jgi:hypothetical protein
MNLTTRYCPGCREDRPFEPPHEVGWCPDQDDGAGECPELACTECGLALVIAFIPGGAAERVSRGRPEGFPGRIVGSLAVGGPGSADAGRGLAAERNRRPERAA